MSTLSLDDVRRAAPRITGFVERSPVVRAQALARLRAVDARLKLESLQATGSFKVRGAANVLVALAEMDTPPDGVVTFSTGNHGGAVAFVGHRLGLPVTVCVPESVPEAKLGPLRECGAELHVEGATQDDAALIARSLTADRQLELIEPFDDPRVIAGQGTIGLELVEQVPELEVVLVAVSGGGLIGGIALALETLRPRVRVVGVCAAHAPAMFESVRAGRPIQSAEKPTLADSLRGGIGTENRWTLDLVRAHVDEVVVVDEAQIARALVHAIREQGIVLEGAAAVGLAALLHGVVDVGDACTCVSSYVSGRPGERSAMRADRRSAGDRARCARIQRPGRVATARPW